MPVTATYTPAQFKLAIFGTVDPEGIIVSRNVAGTLLVNAGTVPVTGGPATVVNTALIEATGGGGADTITLDETNGALPAADLFGGAGADSLTGGSGGDTLLGEADNDLLLGKGGADILSGGTGNDTLTGGDGDDQMFGDDGNDRMIWNPGDDSDLMEGGIGSDVAEINGGGGDEVFTVTANGTRVRFDRLSPAPFVLDIGTTESLVLNAGGGNDSISTSGNLAGLLISLTLDGGAGHDTILGGNGADILIGGDGNDFVDGQQGNDTALLGAGNDVFQWDPGDGSDTIEGQADADTLLFNASAGNEAFEFVANGARVRFTRNLGSIVMDANDVEAFTVNALGGTDTLVVNDLAGTDATAIAVNLSGTIGGTAGDLQIDALTVNGSNGANTIDVTGSGTAFGVSGLSVSISVTSSEGANDQLTVNALGGDDSIVATTLSAGVVKLTVDGGAGNDTILASQGADTIFGGDGNDFVVGDNGNDTAFLGAGNDVFEWAPGDGNDLIEGQADLDELRFVGANVAESINIAPNGGRILFSRDVAAVTMDLDEVEKIRFDALDGADNIIVGDLSATDAATIELRLAASGGGGDGAVDAVTVNGSGAGDGIAVSSAGGIVSVAGLAWTVSITDAEGANDRLTLNGLGSDDVINASALAVGLVSLTINGGLGNDLVVGSAGADLVNGGDGNDTAFLGAGNDVFAWNPGDDNDTIEGQAGSDTLRFNGSVTAEQITISANGGRVLFLRDIANITMDLDDTEVIQFTALGGADTITVNNLSGTDVTQIALDLASIAGGVAGDTAIDTLTLNASEAASTITLSGASGALLTVTGLPASVTMSQFETSGAVVDRLTILALGGNDTISATGLVPHFATLTIDAGAGNDTIRSNGDGTYLAGIGDDMVFAGLSATFEALDGGTGIDTLDTTTWGGVYTINLVTGATNFTGEAFTNFENLVSGEGSDTVTGTGGANVISTNGGVDSISAAGGNDSLDGGTGADTLTGGLGDDTYFVDNAGDVVVEGAGEGTNDRVMASVSYSLAAGVQVERLSTTAVAGTGAINLTGNEFANIIEGNAGANVLNGGGAPDAMAGLGGDDFYFVDNASDSIAEGAAEGANDHVLASVSYALSAGVFVEHLSTSNDASTTAINLTGNSAANRITGNAGANVLNGGGGIDTLIGLGGDDWYFIDNAGDLVVELNGAGTDRVESSVSFSLAGRYVEVLTLTGSGNINATGNSLANTLIGNAGNNVLDGGTNADTMRGGLGNDRYIVNNAGDTVTELNGEGTDTVESSVSFNLAGQYVENLTLTGSGNVNATGNSLINTLAGNVGNNVLDGRGGGDTMRGGAGNDRYVVDNAGDTVTELGGEGTDTVESSVSFSLFGQYIEVLKLTGSGNINATGNSNANTLVGNAGNNVLDGGGNADTMVGGAGNDRYIVGNAGDTVTELSGEGTDTVESSVSFSLVGQYIEMLKLTGSGNIDATGNSQFNTLVGNAGNNVLDGGAKADTLTGGGGSDSFQFSSALGASNIDAITDYSVPNDRIVLDDAIFTGLATGVLSAAAFHTGAAAADAGDRIIYNSATGALLFDADGVGGVAAVRFATLDAGLALTSVDFFVV